MFQFKMRSLLVRELTKKNTEFTLRLTVDISLGGNVILLMIVAMDLTKGDAVATKIIQLQLSFNRQSLQSH